MNGRQMVWVPVKAEWHVYLVPRDGDGYHVAPIELDPDALPAVVEVELGPLKDD